MTEDYDVCIDCTHEFETRLLDKDGRCAECVETNQSDLEQEALADLTDRQRG